MLVLSRKLNETVKIGDSIELKILEIKGDTVRIGIEAPKDIDILRGELVQTILETNTESIEINPDLFTELLKKK